MHFLSSCCNVHPRNARSDDRRSWGTQETLRGFQLACQKSSRASHRGPGLPWARRKIQGSWAFLLRSVCSRLGRPDLWLPPWRLLSWRRWWHRIPIVRGSHSSSTLSPFLSSTFRVHARKWSTIRVNVITILHGMAAILAKISFYPSLQTDNTSSLNATFDKPKVVRCGFHLGEKLHWFTTLDH